MNQREYVNKFLADFNIPRDQVRVKKGPYETYNSYIEPGYYGLYIPEEKAPAYGELKAKKAEYNIGHYETVTTKWYGGRGAEWKTLVTIKCAEDNNNMKLEEKIARRSLREDNNVFVWDGTSKVPKDVTHVRVADGMEIIPFNTFKNCKHLKAIEIPSSVETIGINAFEGCGNITDVYVTNDSVWNNMSFMGGWCDPVKERGASLHVVDKLTDCEVTATQDDAEDDDELDDLSWSDMLDNLDGDEEWMDSLYQEFCDEAYALVEKEGFTDVFTEPSTQLGRGGDFFWAKKDGVNYRGSYDFESEQEMFWNCCYEAESREDAIERCARAYADIILGALVPDDEDDD